MQRLQQQLNESVRDLREAEALNAATPDRLMRGLLRGPDIRAVGLVEREIGQEVVDAGILVAPPAALQIGPKHPSPLEEPRREGVDDLIQQATEYWRISHYTCLEENYGGTHYCTEGDRTASGIPVGPGVAACGVDYLGRVVRVGGWDLLCADTGNLVGANTVDIWCYSFDLWGAPGTPEYEAPCPSPCEEIRYGLDGVGRCYAEVRVMVEVLE